MKQYLLAVHMIEGEEMPPEAEIQESYQAVDKFNSELMTSGEWVFAGGLLPPDTATVVRAAGGDGERGVQVGRLDHPEAADLLLSLGERAVGGDDLAARGSEACRRPVEVRPFQDLPGDE